jgi:hypothetical protein
LADTQAAPVAAGLAAGIVLVALFSAANPIAQGRFHTDIAIEGLKDRYSAGERIDFAIRTTGYGTMCGHPDFHIIDIDRGAEIIFTSEKGTILPVCDPDARNFDETWTLSELGVGSPITIDRIGHYKIVANFGIVEKDERYFIVDNTVNQAIDKTRNRGEVAEFLAYYPNANVTVYFITACAAPCETLIHIPATVEYWYESVGDVTALALLRIGLEHRFDGEPNIAQASCGTRGSEISNEIHGATIERGWITEFLRTDELCPPRIS